MKTEDQIIFIGAGKLMSHAEVEEMRSQGRDLHADLFALSGSASSIAGYMKEMLEGGSKAVLGGHVESAPDPFQIAKANGCQLFEDFEQLSPAYLRLIAPGAVPIENQKRLEFLDRLAESNDIEFQFTAKLRQWHWKKRSNNGPSTYGPFASRLHALVDATKDLQTEEEG